MLAKPADPTGKMLLVYRFWEADYHLPIHVLHVFSDTVLITSHQPQMNQGLDNGLSH